MYGCSRPAGPARDPRPHERRRPGPDPRPAVAARGAAARPPRARAPRVDVDAVVDAAVALADEDGLDAVSLRAVADRTGVAVMTAARHRARQGASCSTAWSTASAGLALARPPAALPGRRRAGRRRSRPLAQRGVAAAPGPPVAGPGGSTTRPVLGPGATASYERGPVGLRGRRPRRRGPRRRAHPRARLRRALRPAARRRRSTPPGTAARPTRAGGRGSPRRSPRPWARTASRSRRGSAPRPGRRTAGRTTRSTRSAWGLPRVLAGLGAGSGRVRTGPTPAYSDA